MAEIKLNLREPSAEKETPINVIIRYNGQKLVYSSGKRIHPSLWDNVSQKAKRSKDSTSSELLNGSLRLITQGIYEEIERYQKDNEQRFPESKELKTILDLRFSRVAETTKKNFFEFIEWFSLVYAPKKQLIKSNETSATSPNTLKTYVTTLRLLKAFAKTHGSFDFKDINLEWYQSFTEWCNSMKNYNPSTIGKHIKVIKTWLRKAEDDGLHTSTFYKHQDFRKPSYQSETIYLNKDELARIKMLDLTNQPELDRIRDLFLIGAWTGLRFSDFNRLRADNINGDFINIKTTKTSAQAVIPINSIVKAILEKYNYDVPNGYANQYMNRQLKVICRMAKIQSSEIKVDFVNGKKRVIEVKKWQLVSTHAARRSFATNLYGLVPNNTIMAITTHKTEAAFLRYLRKSNDEHALILKEVMDRM